MSYSRLVALAAAAADDRHRRRQEEEARIEREQALYEEQLRAEEEAQAQKEAKANKSWLPEGMQGAQMGAGIGGPWGALVGAVAGTAYGMSKAVKQRQKEGQGTWSAIGDTVLDTPTFNLGKGIRTMTDRGVKRSNWRSENMALEKMDANDLQQIGSFAATMKGATAGSRGISGYGAGFTPSAIQGARSRGYQPTPSDQASYALYAQDVIRKGEAPVTENEYLSSGGSPNASRGIFFAPSQAKRQAPSQAERQQEQQGFFSKLWKNYGLNTNF